MRSAKTPGQVRPTLLTARLTCAQRGPGLGADGVAAVGWQISGRGGGLYDVASLIYNSVLTAYRQQAEKQPPRYSHDTLLRMGVHGYSFDDCGATASRCCAACSSPP